MPDDDLDVAALGDDELAQLIQDCNSQLQGRVAVGWRQRREPAKAWNALSHRNLRALRQEARREALSRGIVTIPAAPQDAQEMFSTISRMIAAGHRGVAERYLSAATLTPKPEHAAPDAKTEVVEPKAEAAQKSGEEQQSTPERKSEAEEQKIEEAFSHTEDYRSVTSRGRTFLLTPRQAQFIQILHEAYKSGRPYVSIHTLMEELGTPNSRWQDTFSSSPEAREELIRISLGGRRGFIRLDLPDPPA
jgi:hypothetical protein